MRAKRGGATLALGVLGLMAGGGDASARWETIDEAGAANVGETAQVTVNADGTFEETVDQTLEIRRDAARESLGTVSFSYGAAATSLVSVKGETINKGRVIPVDKEHVEDKAERGEDLGFDKINRVSLAFPEVVVGSRLHYTYTLKTHTIPVAGHFAETFHYGSGLPEMPPETLTVRSRLPLYVDVSDKDGYLSVDHHKDGALDVVRVTLKRPVYFKVVNEKDGGWFPRPPEPTVALSTTKDWGEIGETLAPAYEHVLTATLPASVARLADEAKAQGKDFTERVNLFASALADHVRYMGDWRTVKGGHVPRPLDVIASTGFGDCKDMAAMTAAALRHMGYKADVALVFRSESLPQPQPLPTVGAFNHAIVRAEDEAGHVRWVDPTNRVSRAQGVRVDIAGRPSLVVHPGRSRLETTTPLSPDDVAFTRQSEIDYRPAQEEVVTRHRMALLGAMAESMTGAQLVAAKSELDESLLREVSDGNQVLESRIEPYDLTSRVVKDLSFDVAFRSRWPLEQTTAGYAFPLQPFLDNLAKLDLGGRVSGYYLGRPEHYETVDTLVNAQLVGEAAEPCAFDTKWLSGERKVETRGDDVMITRSYRVKAYGLAPDDLKSPDFTALQTDLKHCVGAYAVIFQKGDAEPMQPLFSH